MKTEEQLLIACYGESDTEANAAMKELKERFDPTYHFCLDCDGLPTTEKNCCLNREID